VIGQFFAVGSGRCGSTLLSELVRLHPQALSLSELLSLLGGAELLGRPPLDGRALWELLTTPNADLAELLRRADVPEVLVSPPSGEDRSAVARLAPLLLVPLPHLGEQPEALLQAIGAQVCAYPTDRLAIHLTRLFAWLCRKLQRSLWVERSGNSLAYVAELIAQFPESRFVHVGRDGRDCAYSMARHPYFRVLLARILSRDPRLNVADCLEHEIAIDRFGAYWSSLMLRQARLLHRLGPERVMLLRYEELTADPDAQLARLALFCELTAGASEWIATARQRMTSRDPQWTSLPSAERARLERACLPGLRVLERLR
jgi:putative sulfotransferase